MLPPDNALPRKLKLRIELYLIRRHLTLGGPSEDLETMLMYLDDVSPLDLHRGSDSSYWWIRTHLIYRVCIEACLYHIISPTLAIYHILQTAMKNATDQNVVDFCSNLLNSFEEGPDAQDNAEKLNHVASVMKKIEAYRDLIKVTKPTEYCVAVTIIPLLQLTYPCFQEASQRGTDFGE